MLTRLSPLALVMVAACSRTPEVAAPSPTWPLPDPDAGIMPMDHVPTPPLFEDGQFIPAGADHPVWRLSSFDPADDGGVQAYLDDFMAKQVPK